VPWRPCACRNAPGPGAAQQEEPAGALVEIEHAVDIHRRLVAVAESLELLAIVGVERR
jgi:hypothetical protein